MEQAKNWEDVKPITDVNWLGCLLSSNLKRYKLGDIAEIIISSVDKKTKDGEQKIRLCNFVDVYHNWAITKSMHNSFMIASAKEKDIERLSLKKGYVALTKDSETRDDIGISTYIADNLYNVILGYHCALVKPNEDILSGKYLNAFLHSNYIKKYFELNATGSGMRYTLSIQTLYDMPILLPSLEEQEYIGNIFSTIDRKIELNRSINHNLEAMAKQLYDYWFVQFDFPDENGKPYKNSGGKMVWNEKLKREIPKDWCTAGIFDELSVQYGFPFSTELFTETPTNIPIVRIRDIVENSISAYSSEKTDIKYKLQKQDLLIGMDGNFHMNYWNDNISYLNQRSVRLRGKISSTVSILQARFDIAPYIKAKELRAKGSTVGHLSDKDLKDLYVLVSPNHQIRKIFDNLLVKIIENRCETTALSTLRDSLLPLLMNGQVSLNYDL
ncbi:MAG: restriction endonuclease subunit S, partial [Prevotella pallens]|nr:restriction endonuclease subunit S [Prevotella pallens]